MPIVSIPYKFDVTSIDQYVGAGGEPLPSGWYLMPITDMEVKENNKKDTGHNLALTSSVIEPAEFKGRKLFENLNLWHATSSAAVEIAEKQLSSIGHSVGVPVGTDLAQLGNVPMLVEVRLDAAQPDKQNPNTGETIKGRGPSNSVVQRKMATPENIALYLHGQPANGAAPGAAAPNMAPQAAAASAAPAFNPAASAAPAAAAQQAPAFNPAAAAPAANAPSAAPAPAAGGAVPPWQKTA
jgi:hypothetical protein